MPRVEHIVGTAEIRRMLGGISRERVHQLSKRPGFPDPVAVLSAGSFWRTKDILAWMEREGRSLTEEP